MSKVTITEVNSGDEAVVAQANATITSWNSASTDVDDDNIREEGLDRFNFANTFYVFGDTDQIGSASGIHESIVGVVAGFTEFTTKIDCGAFNFDNTSDMMKVMSSVEISGTGLLGAVQAETCIGYKTGAAGAPTALSNTARKLRFDIGVAHTRIRGVLTQTHVFTTGGAGSNNRWFTLLYRVPVYTGATNLYFRNPTITAIMMKK